MSITFYIEKLKSYLFELCLVALLIKTMAAGSTIADALVLISLVVSICYAKYHLGKQKADFTAEQVERLDKTEKTVQSLIAMNSIKRGVLGEKK